MHLAFPIPIRFCQSSDMVRRRGREGGHFEDDSIPCNATEWSRALPVLVIRGEKIILVDRVLGRLASWTTEIIGKYTFGLDNSLSFVHLIGDSQGG